MVSRTPRKPFFLGDLPHAWVASDYVRSALDLFAYEREETQALVLAAGIPADWLEGEGIEVGGLRTPHGALGYSLRREGAQFRLRLAAGAQPPGGFVLALPDGREIAVPAAPADIAVRALRDTSARAAPRPAW